MLQTLLSHGALVNSQDLKTAAATGNVPLFRQLLAGSRISDSLSFLTKFAVWSHSVGMVDFVLQQAVRADRMLSLALDFAIRMSDHQMVGYLLTKKPKLERPNAQFLTPFLQACFMEDVVIMDMLMKAGADMHAQDDYAMQIAADSRQGSVVLFLISHGFSMTDDAFWNLIRFERLHILREVYYLGFSPGLQLIQPLLDLAYQRRDSDLFSLVLAHAPSFFHVQKSTADTFLEWAAASQNKLNVWQLIYHHANPDSPRALMAACRTWNVEIISILADCGADIHFGNEHILSSFVAGAPLVKLQTLLTKLYFSETALHVAYIAAQRTNARTDVLIMLKSHLLQSRKHRLISY
jgi:ankyrin repeat protein